MVNLLTYTASQLRSVLHGMSRPRRRIDASVYKTLKATGINAVRPTHRGTKRPVKWTKPVLTSTVSSGYIYKQTRQRGCNANNIIQIPTNRWDFPNILCANARSVTKKIDELDAECQNKCIDIAAITETWLKDDILSISLQLSGFYPLLRNDRNSRRGGAVACYVRQGIQYKHWEELQELCAETVFINNHAETVIEEHLNHHNWRDLSPPTSCHGRFYNCQHHAQPRMSTAEISSGRSAVGWRLQQYENVTCHWQLPSETDSGQTDKEGCHPRQDPNRHG